MTFQATFSKYKVKWPLLPPWITFAISCKWKWFLHKSCSYFIPFRLGHKFCIIWIWNEGDTHFRSWGKLLVQWWWSKMIYNVSSYHMLIIVELALPRNIRVELGSFNLIMQLEWLSSHTNWESYGLGKLTSKLLFKQNDL